MGSREAGLALTWWNITAKSLLVSGLSRASLPAHQPPAPETAEKGSNKRAHSCPKLSILLQLNPASLPRHRIKSQRQEFWVK